MIIQHNVTALNAHRQLGINNSQVKKGLEKLSSGYRINRAADDAAGLGISEKMRAQITGLSRAVMNAQDGVSLVQTAEGALQEVHSMLNRMVELATQSANGTLGQDERQKIESELDALKEEIDRVSKATNFNGIPLLDGSLDKELRPVTYITPSGDITPADITANDGFMSPFTGTGVDPQTGKAGVLDGLPQEFITRGTGPITVTATVGEGGSDVSDLTFTIADRNGGPDLTYVVKDVVSQMTNARNAEYPIDLSPFGSIVMKNTATSNLVAPRIMLSALGSYLNNLNPQLEVSAKDLSHTVMEEVDIDGLILQVGETDADHNKIAVKIENISSKGLGIENISMVTQAAAAKSIDGIRDAIDKVSVNRGNLGALQNRLEHTIDNLEVSVENITSAESRIRDADMAKEAMNLTKNDILTQSSQSMLAQANMQPQQVLQLLQ